MKPTKSNWQYAGKLRKRDMAVKGLGPIGNLHDRLRTLYPEGDSIGDYGCSKLTNKYLEFKVRKSLLKDYPFLDPDGRKIASSAAMIMLCYAPVTIDNVEDFIIFKKE